jgi:hypothetical protein
MKWGFHPNKVDLKKKMENGVDTIIETAIKAITGN